MASTMFSPGSLWADNCPSFQPGLGEVQLCGSLGLGSRNFLAGLSTVRISCLFSLKGKPWKRGDTGGDYFHPEVYPKALVVCQGLNMVYTRLLKITP